MAVLEFTVTDGVALMVMNRPEVMNAADTELRQKMEEAFQRIEDDPEIRVGILMGAGDRAFSTGSDLKKSIPGQGAPMQSAGSAFGTRVFREMSKPMIAAVNGYALGGGCELALRCDIRICSETAKFGLTEVKVGSIPGDGGTQRLPRTVGVTNAMYLLLTGDHADAEMALRIGLVSKIVPQAELLNEAMAIAKKIAANAPLSVRAIKRVATAGLQGTLKEGLEFERLAFNILFNSEDRIEGRKAFAEKRKPNYVGR
jgi:E-phenylitaconyl-CoA hydratase